jgi:hypothetical protein
VLWYDLTLTPQNAAGQSLQNLSLEIPFNSANATLYATGDAGMGGEAGATPPHWQSVWKQSVWIGNEKAGLSWFTESDQNWNLQDAKQALTIDREADRGLYVEPNVWMRHPVSARQI